MRPEPQEPPAFHRREAQPLAFEVETITRLFGGGAVAKSIDERCWLRPPAAKSAIRSWWRAASAHQFDSLAALREAEARAFGSPATFDSQGRVHGGPGALGVRVRAIGIPPVPEVYNIKPGDALAVAYFAGAGMGEEPAKLLPAGAAARIELGVAGDAESASAVREGLRVWLTLGGAGARSRRGAGALALRKPAAARALGVPADLQELEAFLRQRCLRAPCAAVGPLLSLARTRKVLLGIPCRTGEDAQRKLLAALREARQDRPHPDFWVGAAGWGQSRWPEGDAIRLLENRGPYAHAPKSQHAGQYPRAALGLPIVVHFKEDRRKRDLPEPANHMVLASVPGREKRLERYASPILLRPVRVWRGAEERYIPVAIFTDCTLPPGTFPVIDADEAEHPIPTYDVPSHADATLARVESVFLRLGFQPI